MTQIKRDDHRILFFLWAKPFKICVNLSYLCHLWSIEYTINYHLNTKIIPNMQKCIAYPR